MRNIHSPIGVHIQKGNTQQNGPVVLILFGNPTMTGPPTGAVNGVLSKGTSTASELKRHGYSRTPQSIIVSHN